MLYLSTFYACVKSANPTANYALRLIGPIGGLCTMIFYLHDAGVKQVQLAFGYAMLAFEDPAAVAGFSLFGVAVGINLDGQNACG